MVARIKSEVPFVENVVARSVRRTVFALFAARIYPQRLFVMYAELKMPKNSLFVKAVAPL